MAELRCASGAPAFSHSAHGLLKNRRSQQGSLRRLCCDGQGPHDSHETIRDWAAIFLSVRLSFICLPVFQFVCLPFSFFVFLSVCLCLRYYPSTRAFLRRGPCLSHVRFRTQLTPQGSPLPGDPVRPLDVVTSPPPPPEEGCVRPSSSSGLNSAHLEIMTE